MRRPVESPRGPSIPPRPGSTAVDAARTETGTAAMAAVEEAESGVGTLPAEVQAEVDAFIAALLREAPADHDRGFRSSAEYRANAVRAGALLREYLGHTGPLGERAGVPSTTLLKYADRENVPLLTPNELQAIEKLSAALKGIGTIHRIGEEQGMQMLALVRLLRKGRLDGRLSAFRTAENVTSARLSRQESKYRGVLTRELAGSCFPVDDSETTSQGTTEGEVPAIAGVEVQIGDDEAVVPSRVVEEIPHADVPVAPPTSPAATEQVPASPMDGKALTQAQLDVINRLTSQSATVVELMQGMDAHDPRFETLRALIVQNRSILEALGITVPEPAVSDLPSAVTVPAERTEIAKPSVVYRTPSGAELVISSTQRGVVLILEGDAPTDGATLQ